MSNDSSTKNDPLFERLFAEAEACLDKRVKPDAAADGRGEIAPQKNEANGLPLRSKPKRPPPSVSKPIPKGRMPLIARTEEEESVVAIAEAKEYLDAAGIKYIEKTGNTNDEIIAAVNSMLDQVDAVFTPTDNVVMAVELVIAETLADVGIPHYAGADSFVRNGAFATAGVNYGDLGAKSAEMAMDIVLGGDIPEYHVMDGGIITVNTETAEILGVDYSVFSDMAGSVVEVITTEE